jgi:hypothetical protein
MGKKINFFSLHFLKKKILINFKNYFYHLIEILIYNLIFNFKYSKKKKGII